jgi:TPR repeat protein
MTPARRDRESQKATDERERGKKQNEDKFTGFTMGCNDGNGDPAACNSLGEWYLLMRSDVISASRAFAPACFEKMHPQSCLNIGRLMSSSGGKSALMAVQETLLPQALRTEIAGQPIDSQTAILSEKAFFIGCEAGNADACADGSRILLRSAAGSSSGGGGGGGFGTSQASINSLQRAEKLLRLGCDHSSSEGVSSAKNCASLGALYLSSASDYMLLSSSSLNGKQQQQQQLQHQSNTSLSPLKVEAMELLRRGCEGEQAKACMQLAAIHRTLSKHQDLSSSSSNQQQQGKNTTSSRASENNNNDDNNNSMKLAEMYEKKGLVWSGMTENQADLHILKAKEKRGGY